MKYIQTKFCTGTFILETSINLNNILTKEEQKKFYNFKNIGKNNLSEENLKWYENILKLINDECFFSDSREVVSYEVYDWEEYDEENLIIE